MPDFGWSYPPGCSGPPEEDEWLCLICGVPVRRRWVYCGPSCELADDEGTVDTDFDEIIGEKDDIPFVLARSYNNPFHIPSNDELKEKPNAS